MTSPFSGRAIPRACVLLLAASSMAACSQVQPGHVGVRVDNLGSHAGVERRALGVGWYWTGLGQHVYEYPVYTNTYTWTRSRSEGSSSNEEFTFQDRNGLSMSSDVAVSFSVDPVLAPELFQKYRTDMDGIIAGPLRNAVRDALVTRASDMGVEEIYGPRKAELIRNAEGDVRRFMAPFGLRVERLYWASNIRLPDVVKAQIEQKIANEQAALAAQAQVATVEAQARQRVAEAQGEAQAITTQGAALRANPEVLRLRSIEKWDGRLPQVTGGGATPFINLQGGEAPAR
ncbi:MAG: prohibitin family protein [Caulobacteraceae bacterium]|nr:prohibitin family protein [Caulobacter sp.]